MNNYIRFILLVAVIFSASCKNKQNSTTNNYTDTSNVVPLPETEIKLFDGVSLGGWHLYNKKEEEIKNWTVIDSSLVCLGASENGIGGDLVTDREFENFELSWDWKVDDGSNSGLMYHVIEDKKYKAPFETGPEYQIIDDVGFPERLEEWQKAGADYGMHYANSFKNLKPVGQWNSSKIIFNKGHVEHWLNGKKIVEFEAWNKEWDDLKASGKWKAFPDYGLAKKGRIALQDHGKRAYFRNIIITEF